MAIAKHIGISKSRYTLYRQCPKALWLKTYRPEQAEISDALRQRFDSGSIVGDLAKDCSGTILTSQRILLMENLTLTRWSKILKGALMPESM